MSRRTQAPKRELLPDPKHGSQRLTKFINMIMQDGKKSVAENIVYNALTTMSDKSGQTEEQAVEMLATALDNVKPSVEVKSRRVRETLAMRWVIEAARKRSEKSMAQRLANELLDASDNRGSAVKKREDTHRMAEANKAFSHYRW